VVQVAEARKVQRLAATWKLLRIAGAEMAASAYAPVLRPTAAEALISWAAGSARAPWQCRVFLGRILQLLKKEPTKLPTIPIAPPINTGSSTFHNGVTEESIRQYRTD
jgi:hypothetical protein